MSDTSGPSTNSTEHEQEPVTLLTILRDIQALKGWQAKYGSKPLEPVEVTAEQWELLKAELPVRNDPYIFALGVPIIVRSEKDIPA